MVDEEGNAMKSNGVYIVSFSGREELRIGRAHEAEVRINDISVSRQHASFRMIGDNVYLADTKSKFGTLVLLQNDVRLSEHLTGLETQVGRTVIHFQIGPSHTTPNQHHIHTSLNRPLP